MAPDPKAERNEKIKRTLQAIVSRPGNEECMDCTTAKPTWASINLGIFVCPRCAGLHRQIGTHITQIRSITLDSWKDEWVKTVSEIGNAKARAIYEIGLPEGFRKPPASTDAQTMEQWIRSKYEHKRYVVKKAAPKTKEELRKERKRKLQAELSLKEKAEDKPKSSEPAEESAEEEAAPPAPREETPKKKKKEKKEKRASKEKGEKESPKAPSLLPTSTPTLVPTGNPASKDLDDLFGEPTSGNSGGPSPPANVPSLIPVAQQAGPQLIPPAKKEAQVAPDDLLLWGEPQNKNQSPASSGSAGSPKGAYDQIDDLFSASPAGGRGKVSPPQPVVPQKSHEEVKHSILSTFEATPQLPPGPPPIPDFPMNGGGQYGGHPYQQQPAWGVRM